ncbi:MarR family winged helix-turn-helix transcriptional regulator [Flexivirga oryzae]|uniref:DNA-binding MarR family transcriptional regulator n=1 Tax=Flexivirga oryzae TaxID=1794944 RepID=A0A839NDI0_9MICO|nr:MarR family transcriptional regulator [Flexivirga oryzae]MBB2894383.1 DNA-binding MarR family transcriptional regulator [Flexivirga oryzae]
MTPRQKRSASAPSPAVQGWNDLIALHTAIEQTTNKALRRLGLAGSDFRALAMLAHAPEHEVRLLDLADALSLNQSSVSRLVDRLESAGLARRESCGDDRRGVYVVITDDGSQSYQAAAPAFEQALADALTAAEHDSRLKSLSRSVRSGGRSAR